MQGDAAGLLLQGGVALFETSLTELGTTPGTTLVAGVPTSPVPEKMQELQMEAVQSLLGLSSVGPGSAGRSAWAHWEHSGASRADASVRKKLTAGDVAQSRLRVPAPLFELLFGRSAKVVLQAAPTNIGHFIAAAAAADRKGYLLQGESVRQLFSDLNAELEDTIVLSHKGATADGTPIALCALAKAEPAAREAAAAAFAARSAARAQQRAARSAAGSPASPELGAVGSSGAPASDYTAADFYSSDDEEGVVVGALGGGVLGGSGAAGVLGSQLDFTQPAAPHTASAGGEGGSGGAALMLSGVAGGSGGLLGLAGGGDAASAGGVAAGGSAEARDAAAAAASGRGRAAGGGPLDHDTAAAAAALAAAAEDEVETGPAGDDAADPEWQARPKARGRPRKRRPSGAAAASVAHKRQTDASGAELVCAHCGTADTPRWWKDNFPMGTLCNACGIWLKRHGYPRPVQFFVQPGSVAGPPRPKSSARRDDGPSGSSRLGEAPPDVEFYLINGRPKRRRVAQGSSAQGAAPSSSNVDAGGLRLEAAQSEQLEGGLQSDPAINYEAAGGRVFVVRRKLVKAEDGQRVAAAQVHFGWAPSSRAAHEMYDKVVRYSEAHADVAVDEYELLSDCKATATLQLRPGREAPASWDALVRGFVDSL